MIKITVDENGFIPLEVFRPFLGNKIDLVDSYEIETTTDAETGYTNLRLSFLDKDGNVLGANDERSTDTE